VAVTRRNVLRAAVLLGCWLAGCTVGPDYHTPVTAMPAGFVAPEMALSGAAAAPTKSPPPDLTKWWESFDDPKLNSLIERAVASSLDIEIALTRLQEARTAEAVVLGQALPEVELSGGGGFGTGSDLTRGRASPVLRSAANGAGLKKVTQIVGFDAGWEIDLFGLYRREMEAAGYDTEAAAAARNAVLVAVVADVVRAYIDLRGLQTQLAVVRQNIDTARRTLDVVQTRFNRGLTNEFDVTLARRQLATLEAQVAPLVAQTKAAQYAIAVLIGEFPEALATELAQPAPIPQLPGQIERGLPLDLLRRRPDIRQAERRLAGATARIGVATANLFPRLTLTGAVGYQGQGLGVSPSVDKFIWSAGPAAYWSLLDFGTLDALVDLADLQTHELLLNYKRTILNAVQDVDSAIANYAAQQDRLRSLGDALTASQRAVDLATQRYDRGLTDFLNVLDAERQEYDLEQQYAVAQQIAADNLVALYKGLGGGWEGYQSIPPIHAPQPAILAMFRRLFAAPSDPTK
jgi:NodT family efflux transporter outer membrane factor (OMF) lipoprotein